MKRTIADDLQKILISNSFIVHRVKGLLPDKEDWNLTVYEIDGAGEKKIVLTRMADLHRFLLLKPYAGTVGVIIEAEKNVPYYTLYSYTIKIKGKLHRI
ncbi:hypothetical protein ES705_33573 [subsurface metagenome]